MLRDAVEDYEYLIAAGDDACNPYGSLVDYPRGPATLLNARRRLAVQIEGYRSSSKMK